jgi:hypothetical protein
MTKLAPVPAQPQTVTVLQASSPITKVIGLKDDGTLHKEKAASLVTASVHEVVIETGGTGFASLLHSLENTEVLQIGVFKRDDIEKIVSWETYAPGVERRLRDTTELPGHPHWYPLDLDKDHCVQILGTPREVRDCLVKLMPELEHVNMVVMSSGSSGIFTEEGKCLSGYASWHVWILLQRGSDGPDFTKFLHDRAWMTGLGHYVVGKAAQLLDYSLVDTAVRSPERLMYSGPPVLRDGLEHRPIIEVFGVPNYALNKWSKTVDEAELVGVKSAARNALRSVVEEAKERVLAKRKKELMDRGVSETQAIYTLLKAMEENHLEDDHLLYLSTGEVITVGEALERRSDYHHCRCKDPLEPDYHDGEHCGWLDLTHTTPRIVSWAHGGMRYTLGSSTITIKKLASRMVYVVEDAQYVNRENTNERYSQLGLNTSFVKYFPGLKGQISSHINREERLEHVQHALWHPGKSVIFSHGGVKVLNVCPDLSVPANFGRAGVPRWWLDLVEYILGEHSPWFINYLAFTLQNPGIKQCCHPLIGGASGLGKDRMMEPLKRYYRALSALGEVETLAKIVQFQDQLVSARLVIISEVLLRGVRMDLQDEAQEMLKSLTASNSEEGILSLNPKKKARVRQVDIVSTVMFTNHTKPFEIQPGDRRLAFIWSEQAPKDEGYYLEYSRNVDEDWKTVIQYLANLDISEFKPFTVYQTDEKRTLQESVVFDNAEIIEDVLEEVDGDPVISVRSAIVLAEEMGWEEGNDNEVSKRKKMEALMRSYSIKKKGAVYCQVEARIGGREARKTKHSALVVDRERWEEVGGQVQKAEFLNAQNARIQQKIDARSAKKHHAS